MPTHARSRPLAPPGSLRARGGISSFPYLEYYESLARGRGALAGKRFAVALEVDPFAKKRVLDSLP